MAAKKTVDYVEVTLRVPLIYSDKPSMRSVQVHTLTASERRALRALYDGLVYEGATVQTSTERPVQFVSSDPIRWLLQQITAQTG